MSMQKFFNITGYLVAVLFALCVVTGLGLAAIYLIKLLLAAALS